jgi:C4-dicarboxylate transporter DctM subunit
MLIPAMRSRGYSKEVAAATMSSSASLAIIIPPSIPMILYGISTEASITDLFVAGIVPGLILTAVFTIHSLIVNRHLPRKRWDWGEVAQALRQGGPAALLPVIILGGIYSGHYTATEAAAVGLAYALLVEIFLHKELGLRDFYVVALETTKLLGSLFPILAIALSLNLLLAEQRVPQELVAWMTTLTTSKLAFLIGVNLLLLVIGCFMDSNSAILIVAPLIWPIAEAFGIDKVHFGIIMTVNLEIGFLTPPVGLNLIVAMSAFRENFGFICRSVLPFIVMMLVVLGLISWIPELSLSLVR